jgi:hypothetical protein
MNILLKKFFYVFGGRFNGSAEGQGKINFFLPAEGFQPG